MPSKPSVVSSKNLPRTRDVAERCGVAESTIIEGPNLLGRAGEFGHVIGVTNHGQSRLGRQCGSTVIE
jgi:hypothetical protein